jgi:hypothetical protein
MAGAADSWRAIAYSIRSLPATFGLRPYSVSVLTSTWSGDHVGDGDQFEEETPILENGSNPKVRFMNEEQRALSGMPIGACEIGPITPDHGANGTPLTSILPRVAAHETVHVLITGPAYPDGAKFLVREIKTDRALHWTMICSPVAMQP